MSRFLAVAVVAFLACGGGKSGYHLPADSELKPFSPPEIPGEDDWDVDEDEDEAQAPGTPSAESAPKSPGQPAPAPKTL